jgi:hypothetical protein
VLHEPTSLWESVSVRYTHQGLAQKIPIPPDDPPASGKVIGVLHDQKYRRMS